MRLGISCWKARRLIGAARALEDLPAVSEALVSGRLSLDKVSELTRFATEQDEQELTSWAERVSGIAIRQRGDLEIRSRIQDMVEAERQRSVSWWYDGQGGFGLQAYLSAAQGATLALALDRIAQTIPKMPDEQGRSCLPQRRADALVALASTKLSEDADPDRATVIVHAKLEGLAANTGGCEIENGSAVHPEVVRRLMCNARVQTIVEDEGGNVLGVGRMHREPSAWMQRQVRYRDKECRFPGCGARAFTQAHHVKFWSHGGRTELDNLLLICSFHHRLVHELRWKVTRARDGTVRWFRPDESEYHRRLPGVLRVRRHLQQRSPDTAERSWRWRESNPRARATDWDFSGRSQVVRSQLGAPTGRGPFAQSGLDVLQRPPHGTVEVSLLTTPIPRPQACRGGRLLNVLSSERVVVVGACVWSGV